MSIIQSGLILNLDAGNTSSYPGTGTIWTDLSGNNNNGTLINGPTFDSANNGSIVFDGVDNRIDCPNITVGTQGTINIWFIQDSLVPNKGLVSLGNGHYYLGGSGTNVVAGIYSGSKYGPFSGPINATIWSNITYQWNGTTYSLYHNGVFISSDTNSLPTLGALKIGVYPNNTNPFNGRISQVQVYNRALSAAEISQNYDATKGRYDTIAQSCLILNLDAGNTSSYIGTGTIWSDLSGNNNHGTLVNGPTFDSKNGGSITFSNTSNQSVSGTVILSPSFTVEVIFMPITMGDYSPVFTVGLNNGYGSWGDFVLHTTATGAIYCGTDIATRLTPSDTGCGPGTFLVNNIYHMTFTFSDGIGSLYKNGVLLKSKVMTKPLNGSTPGPYRIQNISGFASSMRVYDFRIHCKALTSEEVQQNYKPTTPDCEIIAGGTEVFPNSGTTTFTTLYESTCAGGAVSDGPTTGMTITKVGKNGIDTYLITAIPSKGSIFKGWNQNKQTTGLITKRYVIASTQLSVNFTISDNTTWFAIFDKDCSYIDIPFCFSTNKDNLCLSCNEQKTVYFNNIDNQFINNGSNLNSPTIWFSTIKFETLITFDRSVGGVRVGWSFNLSSQELSGGGTFKEEKLDDYDPGCNRSVGTKMVTLECQPTGQIKYFVYLYKNNVKIKTFDRTGYSLIRLFEHTGNSGDLTPVYKLKYTSVGNQSISFSVATNTTYNISTGGLFCFGGYEYYGTRFYTRPTTASVITPDGYYTQLINGQYSNYNVIYRVYEGQVIQVLDCRSDILDCNG